ncbi:MAG: hypothetical protein AAGC49_05455 [Brevundimonas sp.]
MKTSTQHRERVLIVGRSQVVLDHAVALLEADGYPTLATNRFDSVLSDVDVSEVDIVVFGGAVPPETKADLAREIRARQPGVTFVQGLSGIPGLIADQVRGAAFARTHDEADPAPRLDEDAIELALASPREVRVAAWWITALVPPNPSSDSLVLVERSLTAGTHRFELPDVLRERGGFVTVRIGDATHALTVAAG